jgi:cell division protein FtsI/penicillin-binding protein 2
VRRREFLFTVAAAQAAQMTGSLVLDIKSGRILHGAGTIDTYRFHPGSSVKPFTSVAILDTGPAPEMRCGGELQIGLRRLHCSHPETALTLDLPAAIAYSCNNYFARAAGRVDPPRLANAFRRFGLNVQLPEKPEQRQLLALGEWGLACSLAELARAYAQLSLLRKAGGEVYRALWDGLEAATEYGTARFAQPPALRVAGKTGTSVNAARTSTHALFAGWAPASDPRIVVAVLAAGRGGSDAAPMARPLFERYT